MNFVSRRGRLVSAFVGAVAAATMVPAVAPAQAVSISNAASSQVAQRVVERNEFGAIESRLRGTFTGDGAGTVRGAFTPTRFFTTDAGVMKVAGKLKIVATRNSGKVIRNETVRQRFVVEGINGTSLAAAGAGGTAARAAAECDVLNLDLGPLNLDLLGLQIDLQRVVLDIVAVSGAGNLLGNLLCAVTGLLDAGGLLAEISNILNAILAILQL